MGNVLSEEEENEVFEEAYALSLNSPDVDKKVNQGTTAANCQPKHTSQELKQQEGTEVAIQSNDSLMEPNSHKHERANSSDSMDHRGNNKRVHASTEEERQQKLSYVQMAKLGYQELVNAIIRPPRAEYKVCK